MLADRTVVGALCRRQFASGRCDRPGIMATDRHLSPALSRMSARAGLVGALSAGGRQLRTGDLRA